MKEILGIISIILLFGIISFLSGMLQERVKNRFLYWALTFMICLMMFGFYRVIFQSLFGLN